MLAGSMLGQAQAWRPIVHYIAEHRADGLWLQCIRSGAAQQQCIEVSRLPCALCDDARAPPDASGVRRGGNAITRRGCAGGAACDRAGAC